MKALTARSSFHLPSSMAGDRAMRDEDEGQRKEKKIPRKKVDKAFAWFMPVIERRESANPDQSLLCLFIPCSLKKYAMLKTLS